jgi:hypothetical protein
MTLEAFILGIQDFHFSFWIWMFVSSGRNTNFFGSYSGVFWPCLFCKSDDVLRGCGCQISNLARTFINNLKFPRQLPLLTRAQFWWNHNKTTTCQRLRHLIPQNVSLPVRLLSKSDTKLEKPTTISNCIILKIYRSIIWFLRHYFCFPFHFNDIFVDLQTLEKLRDLVHYRSLISEMQRQ